MSGSEQQIPGCEPPQSAEVGSAEGGGGDHGAADQSYRDREAEEIPPSDWISGHQDVESAQAQQEDGDQPEIESLPGQREPKSAGDLLRKSDQQEGEEGVVRGTGAKRPGKRRRRIPERGHERQF